jgi:enamine deaminase RidA (YjgF/YER057c/UK114 family)
MSIGGWRKALETGLRSWCTELTPLTISGVHVSCFRPRFPLLFLSGATPGPFYHSHPHDPSEFDHLNFDMSSQVHANIETIRKIGDAVAGYSADLPFQVTKNAEWCKRPMILHWVSNNGEGYSANEKVVSDVTPLALAQHGMENAQILGTFEVGHNVSDRRFLLETFAMFGLEGHELGSESKTMRIDIKDEFDPKYFMPYVPAYIQLGPTDLAVLSINAASGRQTAPEDGEQQIELVYQSLELVLKELGATFDDVTVFWNRVQDLNRDEEPVLMTRSRKGITRPLAESVLGLAGEDRLGTAPDGTPLAIEYIVVAQVGKRSK